MRNRGFRATLMLSPLLFVMACGMPALQWSQQPPNQPMYGLLAFLDGFFGLFWGVPAWLANPLCCVAIAAAFLGRTKLAASLGAIALLLALTAFVSIGAKVPKDESGASQMALLRLLPGCFVWMASIAAVPAACLAWGHFKKVAAFACVTCALLGQSGVAITRGLWVQTAGSMDIQDVAIDAGTHTFYAAVTDMVHPEYGGIYSSKNGGQTWQKLLRGNCRQVTPTGSGRIYALEYGEQIDYSDDFGTSWIKCTRPAFRYAGFTDKAAINRIAVSPANPLVLYAGANGTGAGLYKSVDGGRNWTRPTTRAITVNRRDGSRSDSKQGAVDEIVVDPADANILIATFDGGFAQSNDGGVTFSDCLRIGAGAGPAQRQSSRVKVVHGGAAQFNPTAPQVLYLLARSNGAVYRSDDAGRRWDAVTRLPGSGALTIAVHPANPQVVYASTESNLYVTLDGGKSWAIVQAGSAPSPAGGITIPYYFNGTAFNSVATVVRENEPLVIDPETNHLLYGSSGVRILIGVK